MAKCENRKLLRVCAREPRAGEIDVRDGEKLPCVYEIDPRVGKIGLRVYEFASRDGEK
jgi:hypothetical protein